jgi:hypothetical protein
MDVHTQPEDWNRPAGRELGNAEVENTIWGIVSRIADRLSQDRKAVPVTEGLIAAGLVEDREEIRAVTQENEEVLDEYFETIDVEALARELQVGEQAGEVVAQQSASIGSKIALVVLGAATVKGIEYFQNAD